MTMTNTAPDPSAGTDLAAGEYWIEFVPAAHGEPHQLSFPAVVEPARHHGLWVRPRLRREVAEAVCEWLNVVYPVDPDWYPLARFEGDLLVVFTGQAAHQRHEITLGEDGRYPLGKLGRWFLSGPTRTRERFYRQLDVLRDAERHYPRPGETVVTCDPGNLPVSGFPARIDTTRGQERVLAFRPEIAEAVAVWCATNHDKAPDDYPQVYFDGDTLVHIHQHRRAVDGYLPWRIHPDADGNYRIDGDEWAFQAVSEKSEGEVYPVATAPRHGRRAGSGRPALTAAPSWASEPRVDPAGAGQVGRVYSAQGFEYDYGGVVLGPDLFLARRALGSSTRSPPATMPSRDDQRPTSIYGRAAPTACCSHGHGRALCSTPPTQKLARCCTT